MTRRNTNDIGARLENWSRWATQSERTIEVSPTGKMIERAKIAAGIVEDNSSERRAIDEADALLIERNMRLLETKHRMMLMWCYIRQARPEVVCRKLAISHRPATIFVDLFRQAQGKIEALINTDKGMQR